MQLNSDLLNKVTYLIGSVDIVAQLSQIPAVTPFNDTIINFLSEVSNILLKDPQTKKYSDVATFGFWIRKSSLIRLKQRFEIKDNAFHLGKGIVFHIAPSNVPVNFAYSLVSGLLTGNANIVRIPSKDFPQITILIAALKKALKNHAKIKPYILLIRYDRNQDVNDLFSSISDVRIVWGGNITINNLRKSPLPPRSIDVNFADRYSLAVIDSDSYLAANNKAKIAEAFYNDTFFSDQNACTSPKIVIWTGHQINEAQKVFWEEEHKQVEKKYIYQSIQGVNKLTSSYLIAAEEPGVKIQKHKDNLIVRVSVPKATNYLMDYKDNSGYFLEYNCENILSIKDLCNDNRCQTIAYIGDIKTMLPLLQAGVKGIDRIVPVGKTMDFDLIWDGYNLPALLTRTVILEK